MSHSNSTFCKISEHNTQTIRFLCLQQGCKNDRLICNFCVRDRHRKHSLANLEKYIDPLARLGMNSQCPERDSCSQAFQETITSVTQSWQKVVGLVANQSKFLEDNIIHQLTTLSQTFSQELVESAELKMSQGTASDDEIEGYVKKISLLGGKNFNDPQKLMATLQFLQKNIDIIFQEIFKKLSLVFADFQFKVNKFSFQNSQIADVMQQKSKISSIPQQIQKIDFQQIKKSVHQNYIKDHPSIVSDSQQRQISEDPIKVETDDSSLSQLQIHIGLGNQDGIGQLKSEMKAKVRRVVVTCCKNPQAQIAKILTLTQLEQLEIYWYQLAKKEYLIKIINTLQNLKVLVLNCANEFDEECCRLAPKRLTKIRKLEYGWDFYNSLREYDENIYFRLSPYTNRGCPLKTSVTRQMVVGLKRLQNVWLGDFMYFRPSNNEIPFRHIKQFTLGQSKGKYFRIPDKLCVQLKDMRELLSLAILHVKIDERKLYPILMNNPFLKTFVVEGCEDITDQSLRIIARHCNLTHLSIRQSKTIEGTPIWQMTNLTTLVLVECSRIKSSQVLTGLCKMRYLTYLNLYGNKWVDDELIREIPNHEHFHTVNVGRTAITDVALKCLASKKALKALCLDCNKITGKAIVNMAQSVNTLEKMSLWGLDGSLEAGSISDYEIQELAKELPYLTHMSIRYCKQLNGSTFLNFRSLKFLEVDRQSLSLQIEVELQKRGIKLLLDLEKEIIEDDLL